MNSHVENTAWRLDPPYGARTLLIVIAALMLFLYTGQRVEMGRMAALTLDGALAAVGLKKQSQVTSGLGALADNLFPLQVSYRTETSRIEGFNPEKKSGHPSTGCSSTSDVSPARLYGRAGFR